MEMIVSPSHRQLENQVKFLKGCVAENFQPSPDGGSNVIQRDLDLINISQFFGFLL
jgi:hypothetical protein